MQGEGRLLSDAVTASDIAAIVSRATGIPVHDMLRGEKDKLLHLEGRDATRCMPHVSCPAETLTARVVGQKQAVRAVSNAVCG